MNKSLLAGTSFQVAWDSTSLGWLKECPRKYQLHMILGWFGAEQNVHLTFGLLYHEAHEFYDKAKARGVSHEDALVMGVKYLMENSGTRIDGKFHAWVGDTVKNRESLVRTFIWYYSHWVDERIDKSDPAPTLILPDGRAAVELSFSFNTSLTIDDQPIVLCGHLDKIVNFMGQPYISDKKSSKNALNEYYFQQFNPNNQISLYTVAGKVAFHVPVKGVIIDAAQVTVGYSTYFRDMSLRTPDQLEEWMADTYDWINLANGYAANNYWPMNDKACFLCIFKKVCSASLPLRQKFLETYFIHKTWDPIEARV